ncbi:tRNA 2-thiouridine(34) synthase MnmA [Desulfatitalea alkaliphila]|uniref:tRNA-specific 2-thiouridylase MnmA n=1 Tax=Desulfatitalea alkaliphila TaxID=2929485 RepID=A0AA41UJL1_9BACT|nr:tRNA 2-thiouridine(34) synthase MnmA [Desulfatitalea alkaliphila]MCJ8500622.1 tRNA 2-thiouridine(34) synthase MnmA [Desulfatitalea alkaliphila]
MGETIAVALSGGIDSMVAAGLLKAQGHRLIGLHFLHGYETGIPQGHTADAAGDPFAAVLNRARRTMAELAEQLGIPVHIIDLRKEFQSRVVDYFVATYAAGATPNPCLVCNPSIKFDLLLRQARTLGAERLATGHYARIAPAEGHRRIRLLQGVDPQKDQSYFLARLTQDQLAGAVLPLGDLHKSETRQMARRLGLVAPVTGESQDVCFIRDNRYADFLGRSVGFKPQPGPVEDLHGNVIGRHPGLHHFTIGQRRGINCPAAAPYYVVRLDHKRNCLIVGGKEDLLQSRCTVTTINWIAPPPAAPMAIRVRIRYRHAAVPATLVPTAAQQAEIHFATPEAAVTPGQGAVFYCGEEVLGGGWIA